MHIKEITKEQSVQLITDYHYSKGKMPKITKHYLGVFVDEDLVGTITLGYGTQPKGTQNKIGINDFNYLEIGRMVMTEEMPHNSESQMLSKLTKWIRANTNIDYIYTMADGSMGKVGYCYQASNYLCLGDYYTMVVVDDKLNKHHIKSEPVKQFRIDTGTMNYWPNKDLLDEAGWSQWKVKMYRYLLPVTKRAVKHSKTLTTHPYPKDKDLYFARSERVEGSVKRKYIKQERQYFK